MKWDRENNPPLELALLSLRSLPLVFFPLEWKICHFAIVGTSLTFSASYSNHGAGAPACSAFPPPISPKGRDSQFGNLTYSLTRSLSPSFYRQRNQLSSIPQPVGRPGRPEVWFWLFRKACAAYLLSFRKAAPQPQKGTSWLVHNSSLS